MASAEVTIWIKFEPSAMDARELKECIAELADMVPDWHEMEKQKILDRTVGVFLRTIKKNKAPS